MQTIANSIGLTPVWSWHLKYDTDGDGSLNTNEILLTPDRTLQTLLECSNQDSSDIAKVLIRLPDSKISRILNDSEKSRDVFALMVNQIPLRIPQIILSMRECPYNDTALNIEGFKAAKLLKGINEKLALELLSELENIEPGYTTNIKNLLLPQTSVYPDKSKFTWTSSLISPSSIGELPRHSDQQDIAKKVFQGEMSFSTTGEPLQTFGINDCIAVALLDTKGNKILIHMDTGMDHNISLDYLLYTFESNGGSLTDAKVAILGGFDSSKEMLWITKKRLKEAGLNIVVERTLTGSTKQILVTDVGFFDFTPSNNPNDLTSMQNALEKVREGGNGRIPILV